MGKYEQRVVDTFELDSWTEYGMYDAAEDLAADADAEIAELKAVIDYIDDELTMNEHHYHCNCASKLRNYLATREQG